MRILGVDLGDARTGLAVSDPTGTLAGGIGTFKVAGLKSAVTVVSEKASEYGVGLIVIGLPKNMNGTEGDRAEKARIFADMVEKATGIKTEMIDERRTTILAAGYMSETGTFGKKRKERIDTLSAEIILQSYLDKQKNS